MRDTERKAGGGAGEGVLILLKRKNWYLWFLQKRTTWCLTELDMRCAIYHCARALEFLHGVLGYTHRRLALDCLYLGYDGLLKLAGLGFVERIRRGGIVGRAGIRGAD